MAEASAETLEQKERPLADNFVPTFAMVKLVVKLVVDCSNQDGMLGSMLLDNLPCRLEDVEAR